MEKEYGWVSNVMREIDAKLDSVSDPKKSIILQKFFKTGKGEYGEGDIFIGVTVPQIRLLSKEYKNLSLTYVVQLLKSKIHERRLLALLILVERFKKSDDIWKKRIYDFYIRNIRYVNSWDLVDLSAYHIVGAYLQNKNRRKLYSLAKSTSLWERRISIVSTLHYIRGNEFEDTLKISEILLYDREDLIHKAVGWMLREVGKRNCVLERKFLDEHYCNMPRVMLRYSIEKFDVQTRKFYLSK